ncbi:putative Ig domain-containing protein [Rhodanobacter sp. C01]|uniref:putative Ig domain-containing protein n=1 Tax=Rhodanobacter sp. C01 TaxID=1945856 RepID=UPI00143C6C50|nr:putative Ig domain-containing protein [Rhodanobacter sp. C01]
MLPLLLFGGMLVPKLAYANECPNMSIQDTSGGTTTFAVPACSPFGTNVPPIAVQPSHGTVSVSANDYDITYVNNGDGATSDSFAWYDDEGEAITVTVTITSSAPTPIVLSPTTAPSGHVGTAYSLQFSATGGNGGRYTYVINTGTLPAGISDNSAGLISGTPTESGTFSFTETATDSNGEVGTQNITLTITGAIAIAPTTLPTATAYVAYSQSLSASGGTAPYTFSRASGSNALPPGINLSASGTLSGTPTATGNTTITLVVTDSTGSSDQQNFTFTVAAPTITLSPASLASGTAGSAYAATTLSAIGGTSPYTFSATGLPSGMTLSSAGVLSGTPNSQGNDAIMVTATDAHGFTGTQNYNLTIDAPLALGTINLPNGTVAVAYSGGVSASGGASPLTYSVASGALPAGLSLNSSTGAISGTPTAGGSFPVTFKVTDANGASTQSSAQTLVIASPTLTISPGALPNGNQNQAYSQTIGTSGGTAPYTYSTSSTLPTGMTLSSGGVLSGTPTNYGAFSITVTAQDSSTGTGPFSKSITYSLTITPSSPVITTSSLASGTVGTAYSQTIAVQGGTAPYSYAISAGSLPPGLLLGSGSVSGTPTAGGSYSFTVQVTDANGKTGSQAYTVTIAAATITLSPGTLSGMTDGLATSQAISSAGGTGPYSFSVTGGSLPPGLSLSSTGTLSGTPTAAGPYSFTVQAKDSSTGTGPYYGTQTYSGTIGTPTITLSPSGTLNAAYAGAFSQSFTATGGVAPYTYALSGTLPTGLSFNAATGTLSGTPAQSGTFSFTVTATDHSTGTGPFIGTQNYTLNVSAAAITFTPASIPSGTDGTAYAAVTFTATGGIAPYHFAIAGGGSLPAGMSLSSSGTLSGTPSASGTFSFNVQATDADGATATQGYSIAIGIPTLSLSPATLPAPTAETAYSQTFTASGGTPGYSFKINNGALPAGLSLSSSGVLSGAPTAAGTYTFSVLATDSSTGTGAPFTVGRSYTVTVAAPSITVSPNSLPGSQVGVAYSQQLSAGGGNGSYLFSISAGALPAGLTLSQNGLLSGTPTAAGTYSFTVTAADGLGFTGSQAYSMSTQQAKPVAVNDHASTMANQAVTVNVTSVDTGPITSIALTSTPAHGTATVSGLSVVYTPAHDFFGTDSFAYTATGPGGTSAPATVTITVTPLAVPTVPAQKVTVLAGNTVAISATTGATGAPFTTVAIVQSPASGTATVSGTTINYTAAANASGTVAFTYTLSNPFGVSTPATVTVTVDPRPVAVSRNIATVAGREVQVNLTDGASGGPFTAAAVTGITPAAAGTARIVPSASGYELDFLASATFNGTATVTFTLSNAFATSAPATLTIAVAARPDPSKDPEVMGVLTAQVNATREFAQGQIDNFQQRLEALHGGGGNSGFQNGMTVMSDDGMTPTMRGPSAYMTDAGPSGLLDRRDMMASQAPADPQASSGTPLPDGYTVWTGGAVNFGSRDTTTTVNGFDFTTAGISVGVDKRYGSNFAMGLGAGYGHDSTDIGHNGSQSTADSYNVAWYGSFSPSASTFVDGLVGYQWLSFDARRYVTADGSTVDGSRDGHQLFASLSGGYEYHAGQLMVSPYGRLDAALAHLNGYTEQGDAIYALTYGNQAVHTTTGSLGVRINYLIKNDDSVLMPQLRLEYGHDFEGSSQATMTYADLLAGPVYRAQIYPLAQNHVLIGLGVNWQMAHQLLLRVDYQNQFNTGEPNDQSILINVQKKF